MSMLETLGLRNAEPQDAGHEASILSRGIGLREPQCSVPTDSDRLSPGSYFYGSRSPLGAPGGRCEWSSDGPSDLAHALCVFPGQQAVDRDRSVPLPCWTGGND